MITIEVPETILQAYFSLPRRIRKGMLIRWIITSDLCTARDCQQFRKESRKPRSRIMFERNYSFYHHCCCLAVTGCSKNSSLSKAKWGAQAIVGGDSAPLAPRSDGTAPGIRRQIDFWTKGGRMSAARLRDLQCTEEFNVKEPSKQCGSLLCKNL